MSFHCLLGIMHGYRNLRTSKNLDSAFSHIGWVYYHSGCIWNKRKTISNLGTIASIEESIPYPLVVSSDITSTRDHMTIFTQGMKNMMFQKGCAIQTDTIVGFLEYEQNISANIYVTSTYQEDLDCFVPNLLGILFGMPEEWNRSYFMGLLKCHEFNGFDDFDKHWPGRICTFSEAESSMLIQQLYQYGKVLCNLQSSFLVLVWKDCNESQHYPHSAKAEFNALVQSLLCIDHSVEQCCIIVDPALNDYVFMAQNNTNGQVMQGNLIQLLTPKKNFLMSGCSSHFLNFCQMQVDYELVSCKTGISTRHHGSWGRKQPNDGIPPECTPQLVGRKSRGAGCLKRSHDVVS